MSTFYERGDMFCRWNISYPNYFFHYVGTIEVRPLFVEKNGIVHPTILQMIDRGDVDD